MPDAPHVPPRATPGAGRSALPKIAGLILAALGGAALIASAFLTWFTATPDLGPLRLLLPTLPAKATAHVSGIGAVTAELVAGRDWSDQVPTHAAWAGWTVIACGAAAIVLAGLAALGPAGPRRAAAAGVGLTGLVAVGVGLYAAFAVPGTMNVTIDGAPRPLELSVAAAAGPYVAVAGAAAVLLGAVALFLVRRSAPLADLPPVPAPPFAPTAAMPPLPPMPPQHQAPVPAPAPVNGSGPGTEWAAPAEQRTVVMRSAPAPAPAPAPTQAPAAAPDEQNRTAVSPVAKRRPQPEWDRNWPDALPKPPAPATPSEQHTQVVRRPPRPVKVSPKPETEAIPRRDPRFDGPTQPM